MASESDYSEETNRPENGENANASTTPIPAIKETEASLVNFSIELEPGTKIRITVESTPSAPKSPSDSPEIAPENLSIASPQPDEPKVFLQNVSPAGEVQSLPISPSADDQHHFSITLNAQNIFQSRLKTQSQIKPAEKDNEIGQPAIHKKPPKGPAIHWNRARQFIQNPPSYFPTLLFSASIIIYLIIHLVGLVQFPIYFFCDESASTLQAANLVNNHFIDFRGDFLPTFFQNGGQFSLSTTVYLQIIPYLLFGDSEWLVRFLTVLISLLAVYWLANILKQFYHQSVWWSAGLLLAVTPTWFLHTRTGFEVISMVTFFTGFLYFYLLYRFKNPHYLYLAIFLGALAFYTYTPGEVIMVALGLMLLISDWRYHWNNRRVTLFGAGLIVLLALPLVRFLLQYPEDYFIRLSLYNSYLTQAGGALSKIGAYFLAWLSGFNPFFWFFPNDQSLPIYTMKGYGNIAWPMLPLFLAGLWQMIKRLKQSEYRLILLVLLAAPTGGALVAMDINRAQVMVIPVLILSAFGLEMLLEWLPKKIKLPAGFLPLLTFLVLSLAGLLMLRNALVNGPTWYSDYGLDGMQWGARQVFTYTDTYAQQHPDEQIYISPNWAFRLADILSFYLPQQTNIKINSVDEFIEQIQPGSGQILFVLTPDDYQKAMDSKLFTPVKPVYILSYPNGQPGFYFTHLIYADNAQQVMAAALAARHKLMYSTIQIGGQAVNVGYSKLDEGPIQNAFDGDPNTLIKTSAANPLTLELNFPKVVTLSSVTLRTGSEPVKITVTLTIVGQAQPSQYSVESVDQNENYKNVTVSFPATQNIIQLKIELWDYLIPEPANVHLWEVTLK